MGYAPSAAAGSPAKSFKKVSIHEASASALVFLRDEPCRDDSRKRAMVFVDRKTGTQSHLVAFTDRLKSHFPEIDQVQRGQEVPTRRLQAAQKDSVNAFREAYGREEWVVGDWRAYQACLHLSSRLDTKLVFELSGKGVGKYDAVARNRGREASKFDIRVVNPANGKYFWLESTGNRLRVSELDNMFVQTRKMAHALKNPGELSVLALVHGEFNPAEPEPVDGRTFIKYLPLEERSYQQSITKNLDGQSTLTRAMAAMDTGRYVHTPQLFARHNKAGIPEAFLGFNTKNCPSVAYGENINLGDFLQRLARQLSDKEHTVHVRLEKAKTAVPDYEACAHITPPKELLETALQFYRSEQSRGKELAKELSSWVASKSRSGQGNEKGQDLGRTR